MFVTFYILAMITFVISVFGFLIIKQQKPSGSLSYHASHSSFKSESKAQYQEVHVHSKASKVKKGIIKRMLTHLLIGMASFGTFLSLTGIIISFSKKPKNICTNSNELQRIVNQRINYYLPDYMQTEESYYVAAALTNTQCYNLLSGDDDSTKMKMNRNGDSFQVSVSLNDPTKSNFIIVSLSRQDKAIEHNISASWKWKIVPLKEGNNDIILKVRVKNQCSCDSIQKDICFIKTINVQPSLFTKAKQLISLR